MADINASLQTSPLGFVQNLISERLGYEMSGSVPFPIQLSKQGGIGFQYEGGVITVEATDPKVQVSFDRPMIYNGTYVTNPSGPFDIGAPSLVSGALYLNIPINVPASPPGGANFNPGFN
jgi:hypothetical protein